MILYRVGRGSGLPFPTCALSLAGVGRRGSFVGFTAMPPPRPPRSRSPQPREEMGTESLCLTFWLGGWGPSLASPFHWVHPQLMQRSPAAGGGGGAREGAGPDASGTV